MKISAVLLAGGQSKRMGRDKAFLQLNGKTFLRIIAEKLSRYCDQIIVSGNKEKELYLSQLRGIKSQIDFVKDKNPFTGPLNGIVSCRKKIKNEIVFISTCDTPLLNEEIIPYLSGKIDVYDAVIPIVNNKEQFLNTVYKKSALDRGERLYTEGVRSLYKWVNHLKILKISEKEIKYIDKHIYSYWSINRPEDYERIKNLWKEKNV
ncbi:molybdenum cofactor guanylyltransferase [Persephonella sp.]|uniref:molybdenum cofactor guanylyltransferase n=1 Tax=Persephonella sp. TaxID=2060922 RepID=UPI0025D5B03D|nr:molybdenum cofactor guanylyltransferase [Persephonella sp.]